MDFDLGVLVDLDFLTFLLVLVLDFDFLEDTDFLTFLIAFFTEDSTFLTTFLTTFFTFLTTFFDEEGLDFYNFF